MNKNQPVINATILNLNSKNGTVSNELGLFNMNVKLGDTLLISSIQYQPKKIKITEILLKQKKSITVQLFPSVTLLKEVFVRNKFTGNLSIDLKNTPEDTIPKMNFKITQAEITQFSYKYLENDFTKPPNAEKLTNPILMNGVGGAVSIPDKRYEKRKKFLKTIKQKNEFPNKIIKTVGLSFFTNQLKIPKEKISLFLSYCEYKNIIEKYYNNKILDVIEILQIESVSFKKDVLQLQG
ncbi:MAG: carboxypeptidase-like regulatory domain-containing protein [Lutibacter sp.]